MNILEFHESFNYNKLNYNKMIERESFILRGKQEIKLLLHFDYYDRSAIWDMQTVGCALVCRFTSGRIHRAIGLNAIVFPSRRVHRINLEPLWRL